MFDLKQPCVNCPFRKGQGSLFRLHQERITQIVKGDAFQCHKTVEYHDESDGPFIDIDGDAGFDEQWAPITSMDKAQQCAGLMAVLHREGRPNAIMQVAERLGEFDPALLDPKGEAYQTLDAARRAHEGDE